MSEHWQILVAAIMIMAVCDGLSLWAIRFIVARTFSGQRDQYRDQLDAAAKQYAELAAQVASYQAVERQVMELRAILPLEYVRKEDFIRHEVVINTKLDRR